MVLGRVRLGRGVPPHFWLWSGVVIAAFMVGYWRVSEGQLEEQKSKVMAKQRAIAAELGAKILPFRDRIERWAQQLGGSYPGDLVAPNASLTEISEKPGVYLRLRIANAKSVAAIRSAAVRSLHDGFTSCLFVRKGDPDPAVGPPCHALSDCEPGLLCNEYDVCAPPPRPYNMRLAYRAMRVLTSEWTDELHEADSDLAVTAYDRDLDGVTHNDVPVAARILANATYLTVVLDEDPAGGMPGPDAGAEETDEERIQRLAHPARVGVWDLRSGQQLLRLRAQASGELVPVGRARVERAEVRAAQQRQANSCALALSVKQALRPAEPSQEPPPSPGQESPADAGSPVPAP